MSLMTAARSPRGHFIDTQQIYVDPPALRYRLY
jgi:hypothetical protein